MHHILYAKVILGILNPNLWKIRLKSRYLYRGVEEMSALQISCDLLFVDQ